MAKGTTYTAKFQDGTTITRTSRRTYAVAWRIRYDVVCSTWKNYSGPATYHKEITGFSGNRRAAEQACQPRFNAKYAINVVREIVEVGA